MAREVASRDTADFIKNLVAFNHAPENRVTPALHARCCVVKEVVVCDVDKELGGRGMRVLRARHGQCVLVVLQAVVCLVPDGSFGGLLLHA